ncbi:unnamed protein product [Diamesa serratosioi]
MYNLKSLACMLFVFVIIAGEISAKPLDASVKVEKQTINFNEVNLSCGINGSCISAATNKLVNGLNQRQSINFGSFSIEPVEGITQGRSSKFVNLISGNAIRIPIGPMAFSMQKLNGGLEVALLKKDKGRSLHERKLMRFFVPAFLVMSQVGWWMLALASVSLLAVKAFLISKLAMIVAAVMTIKKLFEHAQNNSLNNMPPQFYEHHEPLLMPYNLDFSSFSAPAHTNFDFPSEFQPSALGHEHTAALHHSGSLGAETAINNVVTTHNNSLPIHAIPSVPLQSGLGSYATGRLPPMNFYGKSPGYLFRKQ